jgi:hypothetical protein
MCEAPGRPRFTRAIRMTILLMPSCGQVSVTTSPWSLAVERSADQRRCLDERARDHGEFARRQLPSQLCRAASGERDARASQATCVCGNSGGALPDHHRVAVSCRSAQCTSAVLGSAVRPNPGSRTTHRSVSLLVMSRLLGHSSTRMVDLVYGQLDEATLTAAISNLPGCDAGVTHRAPNPRRWRRSRHTGSPRRRCGFRRGSSGFGNLRGAQGRS